MLKLDIKKNIIIFSIDSRRQDLFSVYNGLIKTPNLQKMAKAGTVFNNMYTTSASTVMALSSLINGRWCHEFDRLTYPEARPQEFTDNIFSDFIKQGKKNYILFNDEYLKDYANGIYRGPNAQRIRVNYSGANEGIQCIIKLSKNLKDPYCIFHHASLGGPKGGKSVENEDEAIGNLLKNVDLKTTTIIFYSDHGFLMGEHSNLFHHAFYLYEQVLRVPFIITTDEPQKINEYYSFNQLRQLLTGNEIKPQKYLFADTQYRAQPYRITSILDTENNWKYHAHYNHVTALTGRQEELYNLNWDRGENRNLLNDRAQHPIRKDWNTLNIYREGKFDSYEEVDILSIAENFRKEVAKIWVNGFIRYLNQISNLNDDRLFEQFPVLVDLRDKLHPQEAMAIISNYFDYQSRPNGRKAPKDLSIGYPKLPNNFMEFL